MAAAQRAIPAHLRDGASTNGGEASAFRRNHHQKSQSHMVSLPVPEKFAIFVHTIECVFTGTSCLVEGGRCVWPRSGLGKVLLVLEPSSSDFEI